MLDPIGQHAIQSLGVDIANLAARLAVSEAVINEIVGIANAFDLGSWTHEQLKDDDERVIGFVTTLPGEETAKLQQLLQLMQSLQQSPA